MKAEAMREFDKLPNERILITGASGFIGTHLCHYLCASGAEVHALSRTLHASKVSGLHWWTGELGDIATVRNLLATIKPDVIFHLASHVSGSRNLEIVLPCLHGNLISTVNVLTAATEVGCRRIVLAGSFEEPEPGDIPATPSSPYAAAKLASSAYGRMFYALYQAPVVIARMFMVYGPAQQDLRKLIPYVTLSLLRDQTPKLMSGTRQVDWIYVEDVINGLVAMAHAPDVAGCTIDLGSGTLVPAREVVESLFTLIRPQSKPVFGVVPDRPLEQVRKANTADTHAKLGWKPVISLDEGLKRTVNWYEQRLREGALEGFDPRG